MEDKIYYNDEWNKDWINPEHVELEKQYTRFLMFGGKFKTREEFLKEFNKFKKEDANKHTK